MDIIVCVVNNGGGGGGGGGGLKVDIIVCVVNNDVCINGLHSLRLHDDFFCIKIQMILCINIYTKFLSMTVLK